MGLNYVKELLVKIALVIVFKAVERHEFPRLVMPFSLAECTKQFFSFSALQAFPLVDLEITLCATVLKTSIIVLTENSSNAQPYAVSSAEDEDVSQFLCKTRSESLYKVKLTSNNINGLRNLYVNSINIPLIGHSQNWYDRNLVFIHYYASERHYRAVYEKGLVRFDNLFKNIKLRGLEHSR